VPKISELSAATAVTTDDLLVVVDDPGGTPTTKKATGALVSEMVRGTTLTVPANQFVSSGGSPSATQRNGVPGWLLDAAASEDVVTLVEIPPTWLTYNVRIGWVNAGAGSGNVRWSFLRATTPAAGAVTTAPGTAVSVTGTAGAADVLVETIVATGIAVPTAGRFLQAQIRRLGADALDTLANDCMLAWVQFVKAT
jgi:hypothetical protein